MKHLTIFLTILSLSSLLRAQEYKQWEVIDMAFEAKVSQEDPHAVSFTCTFTHESGEELSVPGFYNGAKEWIIRFSPPKVGDWTYTTQSVLKKLDGKKGELTVTEASPGQKGPIQLSTEHSQRFTYADGTPYYLMAYELDWLFALDWQNQEDIPKSKQIINTISSRGFNQVVMNVFAYDANWGERDRIDPRHDYAKPTVYPFGGSNEEPNFDKLNISFFQHLDRVIAYLNEKNVVSHLMIYVWNKNVNWPEASSAEDNRYFDYVVKRYQAYPNLVWDISKEALGYGHNDMSYISDRIDRLRSLDAHKRLVSVHDYQYCSNFPEKVDFISIQEWVPNLYNSMRGVVKKYPDKPIFNIEHGGYDQTMHAIFWGAYADPLECLWRNYECVFAGSYSTYYWQNTSWYEVVHDIEKLPTEHQPRLDWYQRLVSFMENYHFERLEPLQSGFTTYALHDKQEQQILFLLPENMQMIAGGIDFLQGKKVSVSWMNPFNGELYKGQVREKSGAWMGFRKDDRVTSPFCIAILKYE